MGHGITSQIFSIRIKLAMRFVYTLPTLAKLSLGILLLTGLEATFTESPLSLAQQLQNLAKDDANCPLNRSRPSQCPVGGLYVQSQGTRQLAFPLKHTEVKAKIAGNLSRVEVTQRFENPFNDPLEAVYIFPLPDAAAVDDMEIKIGDRIIKADIKRREEAQALYETAKQQGRTAGLLEQERDNIFTQSLANIKPGEQIEVTIRYTDSLPFEAGNYEFVFPMVVGPRYIPRNPTSPEKDGESSHDRVPDASRINPPILPANVRSGHDINVTVDIDAGLPLQDIRSTSHKIQIEPRGNGVRVQLAPADTLPNKDLILRYRVAGKDTAATVLTQADSRGGHFAVYLIPALQYQTNEIVPKDVVFLMDTSGSQEGEPLVKSKELMRRFINGLNPNDTFTIIDFANTAKALSPTPLTNSFANRQKAIAYIDQLQANGGTELLNGLQTAVNFPPAQEGRLRSIVLITDGYIGNDKEVIARAQHDLKPGNRLYSFGVGSSVNRFLLNRLAEVGRGTAQIVLTNQPTQDVAEKFFRQINNPVLTNVQVSWEGAGVQPEIYPAAPPDLFANQPLVLFGRKSDRLSGQLRIRGMEAGGQRYEQRLSVNFSPTVSVRQPESNQPTAISAEQGNPAVAQLWGRARIKDLMNQIFNQETKPLVETVTQTALTYRLLSEYTAFVAVSEEVRVDPDGTRHRVQVPVELPEGVSREGIFGQDEASEVTRGGVYPYAPAATMPRPTSTVSQPARPVALEPSKQRQQSPRLEIVSAVGLDRAAVAALAQHLQAANVPAGLSGELVFDLWVQDRQIQQIIWNEKASTLQQADGVEAVKQAIAAWPLPAGVQGMIRLTLQIKS